MSRLQCNRECKSCPLLEMCGGVRESGYSCPFLGCKLPTLNSMKSMETCGICQLPGPISLTLSYEQVYNILKELTVWRPRITRLTKLPKLIPMISLRDPASHCWDSADVGTLIVAFNELLRAKELQRVKSEDIHGILRYDGKVILSSIMPDHLLLRREIYESFLETATVGGFDAVIGWDMPVYVDIPLYDSWTNLLIGLQLTAELSERGIPTLPLVKGNNQEQIGFSVRILTDMGFKDLALHASEYLSVFKRSPEARHILYEYAHKMGTAERILVIGATRPHALENLQAAFHDLSKVSTAGMGWFLDAKRFKLYSESGPINLRELFVECNCPVCINADPTQTVESLRTRASHNLYYVRAKTEKRPYAYNSELYNFIAQEGVGLVVSDLYIGNPDSLWEKLTDLIQIETPRYLIFLGNVFDFRRGHLGSHELTTFFGTLRNLHCLVFATQGCDDPEPEELLKALDMVAFRRMHRAYAFRNDESLDSRNLADLFRFHELLQKKLIVKMPKGKILVAEHGHKIVQDPIIKHDDALTTLTKYRRRMRADWLIVGHLQRAFIDEGASVASPGTWLRRPKHPDQTLKRDDVARALKIHQDGAIELIPEGEL